MSDDLQLVLPVRGSLLGGKPGDPFEPKRLSQNSERNFKRLEEFLQNLRVSDANITNLNVSKLTGGEITVDITVSGLIEAPAATGWRVSIGDASFPLRYWDGSNVAFSVDDSGNVLLIGEIDATGGAISGDLDVTGTLLVTGLIVTPALTGMRLETGDSSFPIRFWDGSDTVFAISSAGDLTLTGTIANSAGDPIIRTNGFPRAKVEQINNQTFATGVAEEFNWASITTIWDTDSFVDSANDRMVMPFTGQYLVSHQERWEGNSDGTGRRSQVLDDGVEITELTDFRRAHAESGTTTTGMTAQVGFSAGDFLTLEGTQYSGSGLDINDWSLQVTYLGNA